MKKQLADSDHRNCFLLIGIGLALIGLLFYVNVRSGTWLHQRALLDALQFMNVEANTSHNFIIGSLPSFLFVVYMSMFSGGLVQRSKTSALKISTFWFVISTISELLQLTGLSSYPLGTFDALDVAASLLGAIVAYLLLSQLPKSAPTQTFRKVAYIPLTLVAFSSIMGTTISEDYCETTPKNCVSPVFLSLDELRADIEPELGNTAILKRPGKIYLYQEYLLIADKYRGVHIFDNTDPQNPMRVAFLPIPGATEISIQNGYLYTNSFMDLVTVNLQDIVDASYSSDSFSRNTNRFERPGIYEFVPDQFRFTNSYLIPNTGENDIVIGYVASGGEQVIYGDRHE